MNASSRSGVGQRKKPSYGTITRHYDNSQHAGQRILYDVRLRRVRRSAVPNPHGEEARSAVSNHDATTGARGHPSRRGQRVRAKRGPMINSDAAPQDEVRDMRRSKMVEGASPCMLVYSSIS